MRFIIILLIGIVLFGCISIKPATERNHISFWNYSDKDAKFIYYTKSNEEDNYSYSGSLYPAKYYSSMASGNSSVSINPNDNFYKVELYSSDKLIETQEYTRKELLVDKQGVVAVNKRGKIKKN